MLGPVGTQPCSTYKLVSLDMIKGSGLVVPSGSQLT